MDDGRAQEPLIRARGVRKTYATGARRVEALRGADLEISERGFYAIMGASGSGKSTLLHLLAGLDRADAGEIVVAGHALHTMRERELTTYRRRTIGMVFQQFNLISTLSARENIMLPGVLDGESSATLGERADSLLDMLGLRDRAAHHPDALSGGEQQRVAIARALLFSPRVLFADEPTGNLDSQSSDQLWRLLHDLAEEHDLTVVMVTHEPAAAAHCRRVFVLRDGVIEGQFDVDHADPTELASRYQFVVRAAG